MNDDAPDSAFVAAALAEPDYKTFEKELEHLINKHCIENGSNTPDFILAEYMMACLQAFHTLDKNRKKYYGYYLPGDDQNGLQ